MTYTLQFCGDEYYTAGMRDGVAVPVPQADEVRLWEDGGDEPVAIAVDDEDGGYTADDGDTAWYGWLGALKFATKDHPDAAAIAAYLHEA